MLMKNQSIKPNIKIILIKDQKQSVSDYQIIVASEGEIISNNNVNYLVLKNGEIFSSSNNKDFSNFKFENFEFNLSNFGTKSMIIPKIQENKSSNIVKCYLNNSNISKKFWIDYNELRCNEDIKKILFKKFLKDSTNPFSSHFYV